VTSEARGRALAEDDTVLATDTDQWPDDDEPTEETGPEPGEDDAAPTEADDVDRGGRTRPLVPLVPLLAVLLVLLLAATGWLWFTRPSTSSVRTADYVGVLQAARSEVVDLTSFDYLTLDDDIAEAKRITTGDLQKETLDRFDASRQQLTDAQAVVQTEVVGAAVTRADASHGTVRLVIQSTQKTSADAQAQVVRYRIQAELTRTGERWVLSGLTGR
jgi:Mce-associated membrane protein